MRHSTMRVVSGACCVRRMFGSRMFAASCSFSQRRYCAPVRVTNVFPGFQHLCPKSEGLALALFRPGSQAAHSPCTLVMGFKELPRIPRLNSGSTH
eukprot:5673210-Alexandrium_andersonii.AAC.1